MHTLVELKNVQGKRVLVRASLNEPVVDGVLQSTFRLRKMLPTITFLRQRGAKVILVGHLSGDPKTHTLRHAAAFFEQQFPILFIEDPFTDEGGTALANMQNGDVVLLENLRKYPGEKTNDEMFGKQLAALADIYVNENISASHRAHASLMWPPQILPSYIGLQFEKELNHFSKALHPPHPVLAVIGGAKPETKIPLIEQLVSFVDHVFVIGVSGNHLLRARGYGIGISKVSDESIDMTSLINNPKILLPHDVHVITVSGETIVRDSKNIEEGDEIVDVGPETLSTLGQLLTDSAFVLWNGPLGNYEKGFRDGTNTFAKLLAESTVEVLIGGGDTIAVVEPLNFDENHVFLSTAGGAMIDFLVDGTLPALEALAN